MQINSISINCTVIKRKLILLFIASILVLLAHAQETPVKAEEAVFPKASQFNNSKLTYKIIDAPNKTFGYDIYAGGRVMIHQFSVPALSGNEGFTTKAGAVKVAQLVITKIRNGEMPPTVTIGQMKKLNVIK